MGGDARIEVCPQCCCEVRMLYEGVCAHCCEENQRRLDEHNAAYDDWQSLTPAQREQRIRGGPTMRGEAKRRKRQWWGLCTAGLHVLASPLWSRKYVREHAKRMANCRVVRVTVEREGAGDGR